ncbi:hypothetical protein MKW92_014140 [Papaver armeniacum]|nr:hypothetical protein MKW92_014140 [Papaver armeniacum]
MRYHGLSFRAPAIKKCCMETSRSCTLVTLLPLFLLAVINNCASISFAAAAAAGGSGNSVQLHVHDTQVVMDNGLVQVTLSSPSGIITGIQYNGIDNLLEALNKEDNRGYWDLYSTHPGGKGNQFVIKATNFKVITQNENQVEISFSKKWDSTNGKDVPLNIDKRFVMRKGQTGFYTYGIYEHVQGWPAFNLNGTRIAFKLRKDKFQYMAVSKTRQRKMPMPEDRLPPRGKLLQFKEAALLVDPKDPAMKGQVDDKYMYTSNYEDIKVHGWVSSNPLVGFWQITASDEYRSAGPLKQDLTSHVGPTSLTVFLSSHYIGQDGVPIFQDGEAWKKVYGPVFIYLNTGPAGTKESALYDDAEKQLQQETKNWPYNFLGSPTTRKRIKEVQFKENYLEINKVDVPAKDAYVGLALPGEVGSWQRECKGYQFWTRAGPDGLFTIKNVVPGDYNVYAWVPGFIGDYKYEKLVTVKAGGVVTLAEDLVFEPPRNGTTLWEIGIPDRTAGEFFIPAVDPQYANPLYLKQDTWRQYGLWERYGEIYPKNDLVYTINSSDYRKDWFYAHVTRKVGTAFKSTTWQVKFKLDDIVKTGSYILRVAIASSTGAELQVRFNDATTLTPHFTTGSLYKDNAIARHGIHGLYLFFNVQAKTGWLRKGDNTIYFTQARSGGPFQGIMYDYVRLEGPTAAPKPVPVPKPQPQPQPKPKPVPAPGPETDAAPEPAAGPEPEEGPEPAAGPEPAEGPEPEPKPEPASPEAEPKPETPTSPNTTTPASPEPEKKNAASLSSYSWTVAVLGLAWYFVN